MPKVYNKYHKDAPADAVYIGRPSKWGNPWSHINNSADTREDAVLRHRNFVMSSPKLIALIKKELRGKDLVCFCKPKACHGDILLEIANSEEAVAPNPHKGRPQLGSGVISLEPNNE